ncbi:aminopeptidase N C-terminal domain-containing protein [Nannocystis sp.]|nr:aminopeptidase N C-terminal domain-containing protein [Nannocystis sp.]MBK7827920.1 aminopeptidase N C-terminal domain-containing protein [Nannocystis sp.]MBK9752552.1 aminopeptidase N C-terminal domain-containing protein [Nannocystis sp.]
MLGDPSADCAGRQAAMRGQLERIAGQAGLSKSVQEIVGRALQ